MLAALSGVLRVFVPQSVHFGVAVRPAPVLGILLAGHVEQHGQPDHLLLDEPQVPALLSGGHVLRPFVARGHDRQDARSLYAAPVNVDRPSEIT